MKFLMSLENQRYLPACGTQKKLSSGIYMYKLRLPSSVGGHGWSYKGIHKSPWAAEVLLFSYIY